MPSTPLVAGAAMTQAKPIVNTVANTILPPVTITAPAVVQQPVAVEQTVVQQPIAVQQPVIANTLQQPAQTTNDGGLNAQLKSVVIKG